MLLSVRFGERKPNAFLFGSYLRIGLMNQRLSLTNRKANVCAVNGEELRARFNRHTFFNRTIDETAAHRFESRFHLMRCENACLETFSIRHGIVAVPEPDQCGCCAEHTGKSECGARDVSKLLFGEIHFILSAKC